MHDEQDAVCEFSKRMAVLLLDQIYSKRTDELGLDRTILSDQMTLADVEHVCAVFDIPLWEVLEIASDGYKVEHQIRATARTPKGK